MATEKQQSTKPCCSSKSETSQQNRSKLSSLFPLLSTLLCSSCCTIQLILNIFSISSSVGGSVFTPYKPYLLSFTVASLSYQVWKYGLKRTWKLILFCLMLTSLDTLVQNHRNGVDITNMTRHDFVNSVMQNVPFLNWKEVSPEVITSLNSEKTHLMPEKSDYEVYVFEITGLSCQGCANRVKSYLTKHLKNVKSVMVDFDTKELRIVGKGITETLVKENVKKLDWKYSVKLTGHDIWTDETSRQR